jgi:hypothetical protein
MLLVSRVVVKETLLRGRRRREIKREEVGLFTVKCGNGRSEQLFLE